MSWAIEDKGYTQRRACGVVGLEPKTYRYASTRPDDGALRERLKALARTPAVRIPAAAYSAAAGGLRA